MCVLKNQNMLRDSGIIKLKLIETLIFEFT